MFVTSLFIDVEIVGIYDLFPTLGDARTKPSLIVDGSQLSAALNVSPRGPLMYPNEVWLNADADGVAAVKREVAGNKLIGTVTALEDLREAQKKDPLVAAGWEGILFISFAAILILSAIGFLIYSYLTAQRRTLEFAVLRTMGFSKKQIALVVGFEQLFVIGLGMAAGTLDGHAPGQPDDPLHGPDRDGRPGGAADGPAHQLGYHRLRVARAGSGFPCDHRSRGVTLLAPCVASRATHR